MGKKKVLNSKTINKLFNFDDLESCRNFLMNLYIGESRVEGVEIGGAFIRMEEIPQDQIIQRARELRGWIYGGPKPVKIHP